MPIRKNNRFAWGLVLIVFGCLTLVKQLHILSPELEILFLNFKNYPLVIGIILLLFHSNKTIGIVLIIIALLFRISDIICWTKSISDFIWPALLIIAGGILIFGTKKR